MNLCQVFLTNCPTNNEIKFDQSSYWSLSLELNVIKIKRTLEEKQLTVLLLTDMKKNWRMLVNVWVMDGTWKSVVVASKTSQSIPRTVLYKKTWVLRKKYSKHWNCNDHDFLAIIFDLNIEVYKLVQPIDRTRSLRRCLKVLSSL